VPTDISLGCLSRPAWSQWSNPQLTSADLPLNDMVRTACELVLGQFAAPVPPQTVIFPAHVIVRESTGPVPALADNPTPA
jgi:DNA-binding LacI/PurR family transcriptional regulator